MATKLADSERRAFALWPPEGRAWLCANATVKGISIALVEDETKTFCIVGALNYATREVRRVMKVVSPWPNADEAMTEYEVVTGQTLDWAGIRAMQGLIRHWDNVGTQGKFNMLERLCRLLREETNVADEQQLPPGHAADGGGGVQAVAP